MPTSQPRTLWLKSRIQRGCKFPHQWLLESIWGIGAGCTSCEKKVQQSLPPQFPQRRWNFTSPSALTLRWAQIQQRAANYPAQLPAKPTSHGYVWEPLPSWRPMGNSPYSPAALGAVFITPSWMKPGPPSVEEEQEKHPRTKQPDEHFEPSRWARWPPLARYLPPVPLCLSPICPHCRRLFICGEHPLSVGSDTLRRNGSLNPWEPERDATQY